MISTSLVKEHYIEDTGGGFEVDVFILLDDTVLVVGEDSIVLYANLDAWENALPEGQLGTIFRT